MKINTLLCEIIDTDKGYDNQVLADKAEKIADQLAINFAEWRLTTVVKNVDQYTMRELLEIFKGERSEIVC